MRKLMPVFMALAGILLVGTFIAIQVSPTTMATSLPNIVYGPNSTWLQGIIAFASIVCFSELKKELS